MTGDTGAWSYDKWTLEIENEFFDADHAGDTVPFCSDAVALSQMTGLDPEAAGEALAAVVRRKIMPGHRFDVIGELDRAWSDGDRTTPPPSLPLLALTVLAASRMRRGEITGAHNFYVQLRRLLDPSDEGRGQPPGFDQWVPAMWRRVESWLQHDRSGALGIIELPPPSELEESDNRYSKFIGHALSQAAFRASDRRLLHQFFRQIGVSPNEEDVDAKELRRTLALWARGRDHAGRLRELAAASDLAEHCERLLAQEVAQWDGRLLEPRTGTPAAEIRLRLDTRFRRVTTVAEVDDRIPSGATVRWDGIEIGLEPRTGSYVELPIQASEALLRDGLTLEGDQASLIHQARPIHALERSIDAGGWLSTDCVTFGERHHLLVHRDHRVEVQRFIDEEQLEAQIDPNATPRLPEGWFLFRNFEMAGRPSSRPPEELGTMLGAGSGARLMLQPGLRIPQISSTFLTGGAPSVIIPSELERRTLELHFEPADGTGASAEQLRADGELSLDPFELEAGLYEVHCGPAVRRFNMTDGIVSVAGNGAGTVTTPGHSGPVSGLHTSVPVVRTRSVVVVPAPSTPWAVVVGPGANDLGHVLCPQWLSDLNPAEHLSWTSIDAWVDFEPTWLIDKDERGSLRARRIGDRPPALDAGAPRWADRIKSAELEGEEPSTVALWAKYQEAAAQ